MQNRIKKYRWVVLFGGLLFFSLIPAEAKVYDWSEKDLLIGSPTAYQVKGKESLDDIAAKYGVGLLAMIAANPSVDPFLPGDGNWLAIPNQFILPEAKLQGIVINLAELRLFYFNAAEQTIHVFPIGVGRLGRETPQMTTKISQKREQPTWQPTKNIRQEWLEKRDIELPKIVPAGPDNPLGEYALRLAYGQGEYLIHGTNKTFGIGLRVSSGCIRLRPDDIEALFAMVSVGDSVQIIEQTVKLAKQQDSLYLEVHQPLSKIPPENASIRDEIKRVSELRPKLSAQQQLLLEDYEVDYDWLHLQLIEQRGLPYRIGRRQKSHIEDETGGRKDNGQDPLPETIW